jgi:hypothetical protein
MKGTTRQKKGTSRILKIPALLAFHHSLQLVGGDPGCKGKGSNHCPKMPPNCGQMRLDSGPSR